MMVQTEWKAWAIEKPSGTLEQLQDVAGTTPTPADGEQSKETD